MSTRSFIAKQIDEDKYLTIYCHGDGYPSHNGALLIDHYNSEEKVDELLKLGDLSHLEKNINLDPSKPHGFDYDKRQDDVVVAYGRDRGDTGTEADIYSLAELDDPNNWTDYVYIFNKENGWKYFKSGHSKEGLRDIEEDLKTEYALYGTERIPNHYGFVTQEIVDFLLKEEKVSESEADENTDIESSNEQSSDMNDIDISM